MNQIFRWSPALREKENGDKFGVFQCKCPETTRGAKHYKGENDMVSWDFWAVDCGKITGKLVWIDKNFMEFNGKTKTTLTLAFKTTDGDIDILSMPFDGFSLRNVMNHLCGMKQGATTDQITLTYGVWKKKEEGKVVTGKNGKAVWNTSLNFEGVAPFYSLSKDVENNYWELRKQKGLEPIKFVNAKGGEEYDDRAEMAFWDKFLVGLQLKLVQSGTAIPFSYNSWICGDAVNPSGGGNVPDEIKEQVKHMYETVVKGQYQYFNKETGTGVTASDVRGSLKATPQDSQEQAAREAAFETPRVERGRVNHVPGSSDRAGNGFPDPDGAFADPIKVDFPARDVTDYEDGTPDPLADMPF